MNYREIIESRYNRENWQGLLYDIFRQRVQFWQQPQLVPVDENMAKKALYTGKINLPDGHIIAIYEVELSDTVVIERNRAGIRNLLCTNWRGMGCAGAFMFCFRQNESVLRFSYVSEAFTFSDDGSIKKESTDTKRFTYLLGEGHRSRTAVSQFEKLKTSGLSLKDVTKAFSVEALSDLFFKEYKKQYEDIIEFITGKRMVKVANKWIEQVTGEPCSEIMQEFSQFESCPEHGRRDAEKAVRDYVKKLMGRLVFIQFLQKKGWMGCSAGESWNDGDKEFVQNLFANTTHKNTFVDDVLEPLFNDINTKRDGDITSSPNVGNGIKIPYLNGGLFEKDDYDKTNFPLPAKYMKNLLDFFASYNFTIDENDPDDAEIGVDPEMLGRIFENLLEDNKDKGAFYTPKEIVQYMCRESLVAYLQTDVNDEQIKDSIRQFVTTYDASVLSEELKDTVDQKLKDVKICDPAIGSGAFPMGLLRELYACRKAIEGIDDEKAVSIKTHIIQNNIYGVDIEKGAVDIARLRFWLALIVDEKNPHALPNMDFKIMQGNSLIEQYEIDDKHSITLDDIVEKNKKHVERANEMSPLFRGQDVIANLGKTLRDYYSITNPEEKLIAKANIDECVRRYIEVKIRRTYHKRTQVVEKTRALDKLRGTKLINQDFFLWHTWFNDVFAKGGFDIVIGNPPYGVSIKGAYRDDVVKALGKVPDFEIYYFFFELAKMLVKADGMLSYIVPNTWLFNTFAKSYRLGVLKNWRLEEILDCSKFKIFDSATVMNTINLLRRNGIEGSLCGYRNTQKATDFSSLVSEERVFLPMESLLQMSQNWALAFRLSPAIVDIVNKVSNSGKPLAEYFATSQGLIAYDKYQGQSLEIIKSRAYHFDSYKEGLKKCLWGEDVKRYALQWNSKEWIDYCEGIANPRKPEFFIGKRLLVREITNPSIFAVITSEELYNDPAVIIVKDGHQYSLEVVLAILNSKLATFYHFNHSPKATKGAFPKILVQDIKDFPLPPISNENKEVLIQKTTSVLATKKTNPLADTTAEEREIDHLVYHLYNLTYDEVLIIDPETPITREEYESFDS